MPYHWRVPSWCKVSEPKVRAIAKAESASVYWAIRAVTTNARFKIRTTQKARIAVTLLAVRILGGDGVGGPQGPVGQSLARSVVDVLFNRFKCAHRN